MRLSFTNSSAFQTTPLSRKPIQANLTPIHFGHNQTQSAPTNPAGNKLPIWAPIVMISGVGVLFLIALTGYPINELIKKRRAVREAEAARIQRHDTFSLNELNTRAESGNLIDWNVSQETLEVENVPNTLPPPEPALTRAERAV